jgi:hypothetical protein
MTKYQERKIRQEQKLINNFVLNITRRLMAEEKEFNFPKEFFTYLLPIQTQTDGLVYLFGKKVNFY